MARNFSYQFPIHITARSHNRELFPVPLDEAWALYEDYLCYINLVFDIKIHVFVLMPNHFHMICRSPQHNLSLSMNYFMRETSRWMSRRSGRINQTYGGPYFGSEIKSQHYFEHAYKYCYRNPVKAGLVPRAEVWPYSTLSGILGFSKMAIPIVEDTILFNPNFSAKELEWINTSPDFAYEQSIKSALRKKIFKIKRDNSAKTPSFLETGRL